MNWISGAVLGESCFHFWNQEPEKLSANWYFVIIIDYTVIHNDKRLKKHDSSMKTIILK